jgi:hypothetical protein
VRSGYRISKQASVPKMQWNGSAFVVTRPVDIYLPFHDTAGGFRAYERCRVSASTAGQDGSTLNAAGGTCWRKVVRVLLLLDSSSAWRGGSGPGCRSGGRRDAVATGGWYNDDAVRGAEQSHPSRRAGSIKRSTLCSAIHWTEEGRPTARRSCCQRMSSKQQQGPRAAVRVLLVRTWPAAHPCRAAPIGPPSAPLLIASTVPLRLPDCFSRTRR